MAWHERETKDAYLEFEWAVRIEADAGAYHLGFKLFKPPGSQPKSGPLAEVVGDGQIDMR